MTDCMLEEGLMATLGAIGSGLLTQPSLASFLTLATGWVLCRARRTTTGLIVAAGALGAKHFGSYHRFFSQAAWSPQELWLRLLVRLVGSLNRTGPILLVGDGTVQGKSGKKISGTARWYNGSSCSRQELKILWGHNWIILGLAVRVGAKTYCVPVNLRLYRTELDCARANQPHPSRGQLLLEMVREACRAFPERPIVLLADGQFAGADVLKSFPRNLTVLVRLRKDAALWTPGPRPRHRGVGRPKKKGLRLPSPAQIAAEAGWPWQRTAEGAQYKSLEALWYEVRGDRPVKVVLVRQKNPKRPCACLLCTDPRWPDKQILTTYAARWTIEVTIREAKQFAGLRDAQCRTRRAVERQAAFTLAMMGTLMEWYVSEGHKSNRMAKPAWYRRKAHASFQDMLAHARRSSWRRIVFERSGPDPQVPENPLKLLHYLEAAA